MIFLFFFLMLSPPLGMKGASSTVICLTKYFEGQLHMPSPVIDQANPFLFSLYFLFFQNFLLINFYFSFYFVLSTETSI